MSRKKIIQNIHKELENKKIKTDDIKYKVNEKAYIKDHKFKIKKSNNRKVIDVTSFNEEEQIILRYYQLLLNELFQIKQPNRNSIIKQVINIAPYLKIYNFSIIFKFDFKSFFENIELNKIIDQIKNSPQLYAKELNFLEKTFSQMKTLKPGLGIINSFSEIVGHEFDRKIETIFKDKLILYERYVDDCILIFDSPIDEAYIKSKILEISKEIFGKNMTFNEDKTDYVNFNEYNSDKYEKITFDFLGYSFNYKVNTHKMKFKLGIANEKIEKEKLKIERVIRSFEKDFNIELLLIRIDMYYKRLVYFGRDTENSKQTWQVRGISDSYKEATKLFNYNNSKYSSRILNDNTVEFLKGKVMIDVFESVFEDRSTYTKKELRDIKRVENILNNYYINDKFVSNLFNNKSVLLNSKIGYTKDYLMDIIKRSGIDLKENIKDLSYNGLISIFLQQIYHVK